MDKLNLMEMDMMYALEDYLVEATKNFYIKKSDIIDNSIVNELEYNSGLAYHINGETPFNIYFTQNGNKMEIVVDYTIDDEPVHVITTTYEPIDSEDGIYRFTNDDKYHVESTTSYELVDYCVVKDIIKTVKELVE